VADLKPTESKVEVVEPVERRSFLLLPTRMTSLPTSSVTPFLMNCPPPNTVFEQTWYSAQRRHKTWPAGCTVKFTGVITCALWTPAPSQHHELVLCRREHTCYTDVTPGQETGFTVLLRTPSRPGTFISYWRLTTPSGNSSATDCGAISGLAEALNRPGGTR